jgi:hypothetical protein
MSLKKNRTRRIISGGRVTSAFSTFTSSCFQLGSSSLEVSGTIVEAMTRKSDWRFSSGDSN